MDNAQEIFSNVRAYQAEALTYIKKGSMMAPEAAMSTIDRSDLGVVTRCTLHHGTLGIMREVSTMRDMTLEQAIDIIHNDCYLETDMPERLQQKPNFAQNLQNRERPDTLARLWDGQTLSKYRIRMKLVRTEKRQPTAYSAAFTYTLIV